MAGAPLVEDAVSCHAWSADGSRVVLSPNDGSLRFYAAPAGKPWQLEQAMELHDRTISSVDWCHATDKIATCSHDANAFVLSRRDGRWRSELVRISLCFKMLALAVSAAAYLTVNGAGGDEAEAGGPLPRVGTRRVPFCCRRRGKRCLCLPFRRKQGLVGSGRDPQARQRRHGRGMGPARPPARHLLRRWQLPRLQHRHVPTQVPTANAAGPA